MTPRTSDGSGTEWYQFPDEVLALAHWLHERDHFSDIDDVLYYFDKPWKWTPEYERMKVEKSFRVVER